MDFLGTTVRENSLEGDEAFGYLQRLMIKEQQLQHELLVVQQQLKNYRQQFLPSTSNSSLESLLSCLAIENHETIISPRGGGIGLVPPTFPSTPTRQKQPRQGSGMRRNMEWRLPKSLASCTHRDQVIDIVREVLHSPYTMMMDEDLSGLFMDVVERCNDEGRGTIVNSLTLNEAQLIQISSHFHGSLSMQKLIECCRHSMEQRTCMLMALQTHASQLATTNYGHSTINSLVNNFPSNELKRLFNDIANNIVDVATNNHHGSFVVQNCLKHAENDSKQELTEAILDNAIYFSKDTSGNYVIQYLVENGLEEHVHRQLRESYGMLALHKNGSYVVDCCIRCTKESLRNEIVWRLIKSGNALAIMKDQYGNRVMQHALTYTKGDIQLSLINLILESYGELESHTFGKYIVQKLRTT